MAAAILPTGEMMNTRSFFGRLCRSSIPRLATITLVALAWGSLAFCDEIHDAARDGDLAKVQALLEHHPDLVFSKDNDGRTPLHAAAMTGHKDVAELLLAKGADVNARDNHGGTPLHAAAMTGHKDVVELLLAKGANINARRNDGMTSLHLAVAGGHNALVELLVAHGADVNAGAAAINWGREHFMDGEMAIRHGDVTNAGALLKQHPELIYTKNQYGWTLLHIAARTGRVDMAKLLLDNGADVNATDSIGMTPLCQAANVDVAAVLLSHGADVNAESPHLTPEKWALDHHHQDVADLIKRHSAQRADSTKPSAAAAENVSQTASAPAVPAEGGDSAPSKAQASVPEPHSKGVFYLDPTASSLQSVPTEGIKHVYAEGFLSAAVSGGLVLGQVEIRRDEQADLAYTDKGSLTLLSKEVEIKGGRSAFRISSSSGPPVFVLAGIYEKNDGVGLFQCKTSKGGRSFSQNFKKSSTRRREQDNTVATEVDNYGQSAYRLAPLAPLKPGEYVLWIGREFYTFGVD
jgi:ankyrin repeat protein